MVELERGLRWRMMVLGVERKKSMKVTSWRPDAF